MSTDSAIKGLITAFLYGIGGYLICKSELTLGSLTAFITYSNYVINPLYLLCVMAMQVFCLYKFQHLGTPEIRVF